MKRFNFFSILQNDEGYLLLIVTVIGLILAITFGYTLPQLHTGQQTRAINTLNEYRAFEAARKGINAVRLGLKFPGNFQELMGPSTNGKGILWAIDQLCGATTTSSKHDEYPDDHGTIRFVSGCGAMDLTEKEDGSLHVAYIVHAQADIRIGRAVTRGDEHGLVLQRPGQPG